MAKTMEMPDQIILFITLPGQASRSDIMLGCFNRHKPKLQIDATANHLIGMTPSRNLIQMIDGPKTSLGTPATVDRIA